MQEISELTDSLLKGPFRELRLRRGWTKKRSALEMGTSVTVITAVEMGRIRLPVKFYEPLMKIGEHPGNIAINQEKFISMCRKRTLL